MKGCAAALRAFYLRTVICQSLSKKCQSWSPRRLHNLRRSPNRPVVVLEAASGLVLLYEDCGGRVHGDKIAEAAAADSLLSLCILSPHPGSNDPVPIEIISPGRPRSDRRGQRHKSQMTSRELGQTIEPARASRSQLVEKAPELIACMPPPPRLLCPDIIPDFPNPG